MKRQIIPGMMLFLSCSSTEKHEKQDAANQERTEPRAIGSVEERIIEIVCEQMGASRDKVTAETRFVGDLGADSLDKVELVMEFEDEFDLNIPDEDACAIKTVGDAIRYVRSHTGKS